jgi:hypothetical protein
MDFRYGIVIPIDELLSIEARKKKMNKEEYMRSLVEESLNLYPEDSDEVRKAIWGEYNRDKIKYLNDIGRFDYLDSLYPLSLGSSIIDGNIFIGIDDLDINEGLVPISRFESLIPEDVKNNVKRLLREKGYGNYIPSAWIDTSYDSSRKKYTSAEKLP